MTKEFREVLYEKLIKSYNITKQKDMTKLGNNYIEQRTTEKFR